MLQMTHMGAATADVAALFSEGWKQWRHRAGIKGPISNIFLFYQGTETVYTPSVL